MHSGDHQHRRRDLVYDWGVCFESYLVVIRSPVTEVRSSLGGSRVTALHDSSCAVGSALQRNVLRHVDVDAQASKQNCLRIWFAYPVWEHDLRTLYQNIGESIAFICQILHTTLVSHLQAELGTASDFLEGYELMAFGFPQPSVGDIVIAGAVHGGIHR